MRSSLLARIFPEFHRDRLFYNMSVWESLEASASVHLLQRPCGTVE